MSVRRLRVCALWLFVLAPAVGLAQDVRLSMSASSNRVRVGEPFAVEVRADISGGSGDEEIELPDFGKLELLGRRVSRPFSFSFGFGTGGRHAQVQSQIVYTFTLRALEAGSYRIPPASITVNGRRFTSRPITIEASGDAVPPQPGAVQPPPGADPRASVSPPDGELDGARFDRDMFVRTVVDKRRAYVGEQVTVTVYLYVRGGLRDTPTVTREPTNEGFWTHDLLPPQRSLSAVRQEVQGRVFSVYVLRRYAAFPMRPGKLQIGATSIETGGGGSLFDLLTGPAEPIRRTGVPVEVEAAELPARSGAKHPVHVGELSLTTRLDPASAKVGDAVTLRVTAQGLGNLRGLKLERPQLQGVDVLQPEIQDTVTTDLDQVGGERVFTWLMLPREPGTYKIPPFAVDVLDPRTGTYDTVRSRELSLSVTGKASGAIAATPGSPTQTDDAIAGEPSTSFGPARLESELRRARPPLHTAPWFPWLVAAAPLGAALAFGGSWATRKRAELAHKRHTTRDAMRAAESQLERAREHLRNDAQAFLAAVSQALQKGLEAKIGEPVGGLTWSMLRQHLDARGLDARLAEQVVGKLEQLEQLRFIPVPKSPDELQALLNEANVALQALAQAEVRA